MSGYNRVTNDKPSKPLVKTIVCLKIVRKFRKSIYGINNRAAINAFSYL